MRQVTLVLMVLLLTAPAMAILELECEDVNDPNNPGLCEIRYKNANPANLPRAFALTVDVNNGSKITDCNAGDANLVDFYIYPGTIDLNDVNNPKFGSPVAPNDDPGASGTGLTTGTIILEMGSLYQGGANAPNVNGVLCTVTVDGNSCVLTVTPEENTRGGIVLEDGSTSDANTSCEVSLDPACWTCCQPCGDGNNDQAISGADIGILANAWNGAYYDACCDYNRDGAISGADIGILAGTWMGATGCSLCSCP